MDNGEAQIDQGRRDEAMETEAERTQTQTQPLRDGPKWQDNEPNWIPLLVSLPSTGEANGARNLHLGTTLTTWLIRKRFPFIHANLSARRRGTRGGPLLSD